MRRGFTLVELLVCVAILALLAGLAWPTLGAAREQARVATCAAALHGAGVGLSLYAGASNHAYPPFSIGDASRNDLVLSGHWGGISQKADPDYFVKAKPFPDVNLFALAAGAYLSRDSLICPSSGLDPSQAQGYFGYSDKFSTYGMRFPYSAELFSSSVSNLQTAGMAAYKSYAGGQVAMYGTVCDRVPQVRQDRTYRIDARAACGDGDFDASADSVASDMFWRQEYDETPAARNGVAVYRVAWRWSHGSRFNVLYGGGAVRQVVPDAAALANCNSPGRSLPSDGVMYASYAEIMWQFFDAAR